MNFCISTSSVFDTYFISIHSTIAFFLCYHTFKDLFFLSLKNIPGTLFYVQERFSASKNCPFQGFFFYWIVLVFLWFSSLFANFYLHLSAALLIPSFSGVQHHCLDLTFRWFSSLFYWVSFNVSLRFPSFIYFASRHVCSSFCIFLLYSFHPFPLFLHTFTIPIFPLAVYRIFFATFNMFVKIHLFFFYSFSHLLLTPSFVVSLPIIFLSPLPTPVFTFYCFQLLFLFKSRHVCSYFILFFS